MKMKKILCKDCVNKCKQSKAAIVLDCPFYLSVEQKHKADIGRYAYLEEYNLISNNIKK